MALDMMPENTMERVNTSTATETNPNHKANENENENETIPVLVSDDARESTTDCDSDSASATATATTTNGKTTKLAVTTQTQTQSEAEAQAQADSTTVENNAAATRTNEEDSEENIDRETDSSSPPPVAMDYDPTTRTYSYAQLDCFNMLVHPIWIFDSVERRMRWANRVGWEMWNAKSLEELQNRNFQDVSASSAKRMEDYLVKLSQGLNVPDQWTLYPKGKAKTVHMNVTAVRFKDDATEKIDDHFSLLCEGIPLAKQDLLNQNLRSNEMVRHLPMAVCQFDMQGKVMFQNPEASQNLNIHSSDSNEGEGEGEENNNVDTDWQQTSYREDEEGSVNTAGSVNTNVSVNTEDSSKEVVTTLPEPSSKNTNKSKKTIPKSQTRKRKRKSDLINRFVDATVGQDVLKQIQEPKQHKVDLEAMLYTQNGPKWSAIQLRKAHDPVTGEVVILYNARDKSDAIKAQEEKQAREQNSEFLAIMAHEIRTPLHQVIGFIDLLGQTILTDEQRSFINLLKTSATGLMTVISDVLDFSKLEAGKMKLEVIPYQTLGVFEGCMEAVRASCEEKSLYLKLDWDKDIPFRVSGDPNRLRQILLNLLSNAVKFTKLGGISVTVKLLSGSDRTSKEDTTCNENQRIKFVVSDTGMGISSEHKDLIFRKYQQANISVARNFGGTGLGLSICQSLVDRMGGSIGFESQPGEGTSFWVDLPIEIPSDQGLREPEEISVLEEPSSLHILIAEDNKVNQKLLVNILKRLGHHADVAVNGKEAIDLVEDRIYDVVLMDVQMPVMDGLEATRRLRSMGYTNLPIYGLTASVSRSDFAELGFDDWLPKPIPMKELKRKLNRIHQRTAFAPIQETQ